MSMLTEKQRQIALLAAMGQLKYQEIAQRVGVHYNTITRVLKMPEAQRLMAEAQQQIQRQAVIALTQRFAPMAVQAVDRLGDLLDRGSERSQLGAIQCILEHRPFR